MKTDSKLRLNAALLKPGMRLAVGVSGGADSVALLRALHAQAGELGLVLSVAHLHHGLRGLEADADLEFVRELAMRLGLFLHEARVDTGAEAARLPSKPAETIEEAARRLRYGWFRGLMGGNAGPSASVAAATSAQDDGSFQGVDAVATAHTLDDQAETVLAKFLRGAWTEGLSGIHPVVEFPGGRVVRPLLGTTRAEVEIYLKALGQEWREDSTNRHLTFSRNRIRHELLPLLEGWNPRLKEHLAQMAKLARDEEAWWQAETERAAAGVIREGKPVRGGGRGSSEGIALDLAGLEDLAPAVQRRVIRRAAAGLGFALDFSATETLGHLGLEGRAGQQCELAAGLRAERTHRELRLSIAPARVSAPDSKSSGLAEVRVPVPGEIEATAFGLLVRIEVTGKAKAGGSAILRTWKAGDRVRLRHSSTARKVKEVLERLKVTGTARAHWPVLELNGRILWIKGAVAEPESGILVTVSEAKGTTETESP